MKWLRSDGFILPAVLSFIVLVSILGTVGLEVTLTNFSVVHNNSQSQEAFNIAEAGINYYLWHLSHNATDYKDGGTTPSTPTSLGYGPYVHNYIDSNAVNNGTYTLYISPVGNGSTIVNVRSIGTVKGTNITRTIQSQIGQASFATYAVASDTSLWFGKDEASNGPIHSNQGIRLDGASNATITSANATYVPSSNLGGDGSTSHPGVWCNSSVTSPVNCNTRPKTSWVYPHTTVDFNQVTSSLCTMKKVALADYTATASIASQPDACTQVPTTRTNAYIPQRSTTFSSSKGYLIQLNTNGTYDLFNVNAETDTSTPYTSALTLQSVATGIAMPPSGVIFTEDNVWVRSNPTFHGRVNIGAGRLANATNNADIVIADDLAYTAKDGSDAIGLVAEDSVVVAPYALPVTGAFNFEVDAAVLAQAGDVEYPNVYRSNTSRCTRGWTSPSQTYTFYGSVSVRQTWTWSWLDGGSQCGDASYDASQGYISGIENNSTNYDYNLAYAPPPSFPLISGGYNILSWREVLTKP